MLPTAPAVPDMAASAKTLEEEILVSCGHLIFSAIAMVFSDRDSI